MSTTTITSSEGNTMTEDSTPVADLKILYGSETGNAEYLAYQINEFAGEQGLTSELQSLEDWLHDEDHRISRLLIVTSTHDNGHMPTNAEDFWGWLGQLPAGAFEGLPYAVLSIGDSMYEDFCKAGHDIDGRLAELGAVRVTDSADCDIDFDLTAADWYPAALETLRETAAWTGTIDDSGADSAEQIAEDRPQDAMVTARVVAARRLSGEGSAKHVTHYELEFEDDAFQYEPGDSIAVFPRNCDALVDEWMQLFNVAETDTVTVGGAEILARQALREEVELSLPHPGLLISIARVRPGNELAQDALRVIQEGDRETLDRWLWDKDIIDVLAELDCLNVTLQDVIDELRPIQHRAYSIASSPLVDGNRVHLTVSGVEYESFERHHRGTASAFLEQAAKTGEPFAAKRLPAHEFRIPEESAPVVMIGPGVGVAPFRSFLRHRVGSEASGKNWLFFGDQHRECDYLYEGEFTALEKDGRLDRLSLAFSRDQAEKHYVQDEMRRHGEELAAWLDEGGYVFVCGDKARMAPDVDRALFDVLEAQLGADSAEARIAELKATGRFVKDVY
ncbi:diflavin oxidoreductase [Gulosibacter molinativorax]|uniref:Sulfite reductase flavoprotein subunit alpha n=1 Tax=Gulosibacter molinativorax TaxID=256821 RepID=A0ABT7C4S4_9MICO|nr:sulfite reductase flavoprotein subunit alpha [Gulosibacter molinativorax]MDJ1370035.1 sulfite reductase flavoprotein subunit alpha [Gulosibacter molinativorax]QUY63774.1 Sulfite reductase [NADPH] flavoprotein alpha-component [Gulosibacter molinativorax]